MGQFRMPLLSQIEIDIDKSQPFDFGEENKAKAIRQCLRYLQWEAHTAGLGFLSKVIGMAALAAEDEESKLS